MLIFSPFLKSRFKHFLNVCLFVAIAASIQAQTTIQIVRDPENQFHLSYTDDLATNAIIEGSSTVTFAEARIVEAPGETTSIKLGQNEFFRARIFQPETRDYLLRTKVSSPVMQEKVDRWILQLKKLQLLPKVRYMATFREGLIPPGTTIPAIIGPNATANKTPSIENGALLFDGTFTLTIPNFIATNQVNKFSVLAGYQSTSNRYGILVGQPGAQGELGPILSAGGNPSLGLDPENIFLTLNENGKSTGEAGFRSVRSFNLGNTTFPQLTLATVDTNRLTIQSNFDRRYISTPAEPRKTFINNGDWKIGGGLDGWGFHGKLFFIAVFEEAISEADYQALFKSYRETLGSGLFDGKINLVIEGDSLSEESSYKEYGRFLALSDGWSEKVLKNNIAKGGEGIYQMLADFPVQAASKYNGKKWLFLWAGANDLSPLTADQIFDSLRTYWSKARAEGYQVAAFTLIRAKWMAERVDVANKRNEVNEKIRNAASEYDWLIDLDTLPELSDPTDLTYFNPDGIHLTEAAGRRIAELIRTKIQP